MKTFGKLVIIISVLLLIIITIIVLGKKTKLTRLKSLGNDAEFKQFQKQLTQFINTITALTRVKFEHLGIVPITGRGTLNNLYTKDLINGTGSQSIDISIGTMKIDYEYSVDRIVDLFTDSSMVINITVDSDNNLTIIPIISLPNAHCSLSIQASVLGIAKTNCNEKRLSFNNAKIIPVIKCTVKNCTITNVSLQSLDITYDSLSYSCSVDLDLKVAKIKIFTLTEKEISDTITSKLKSLYSMVAPHFNFNTSINIPCLYKPPNQCYPSMKIVNAKNQGIPVLKNIDLNGCKALCQSTPGCDSISYINKSKLCTLSKNITSKSPYPGSNIYYKSESILNWREEKNMMPQKYDLVKPGKLKTTQSNCMDICKGYQNNEACNAYTYNLLTGECNLYGGNNGHQEPSSNFIECSRSLLTPLTITIPQNNKKFPIISENDAKQIILNNDNVNISSVIFNQLPDDVLSILEYIAMLYSNKDSKLLPRNIKTKYIASIFYINEINIIDK
jgi:hypothetical protein